MVRRSLEAHRSCGCLTAPIALGLLINLAADIRGFDIVELILALGIVGLCLLGFGALGATPATRAPLVGVVGVAAVGAVLTLLNYESHRIPCGALIYLLFLEILHRSAVQDGANGAARYLRSMQVLVFLLPLSFLIERVVYPRYRVAMTGVVFTTWVLMVGVYALLSFRDWSKVWKPTAAGRQALEQAGLDADAHGF